MTTTIYALYNEATEKMVYGYTSSLEKLFKYLIEDEVIDNLEVWNVPINDSIDTEINTFSDVLKTEEDRKNLYNFFMDIIFTARKLYESEKELIEELETYFFDCIIVTAEYIE